MNPIVPQLSGEPAPSRRPRGPRWTRRKDHRPSELLEAALDLFVERGYASARLDDVASRAGVSKGTLYLYYANKEELFKAVVRTAILPLLQEFGTVIDQSEDDTDALLLAFLQSWWDRFGGTRLSGIVKLVVGEAGNFPEVARFFQEEVVNSNQALVKRILDRGVARGEFRPMDADLVSVSLMAPLVLKSIWAHSLDQCCGGSAVEPPTLIRHHVGLLLESLRARPAPARSARPVDDERS